MKQSTSGRRGLVATACIGGLAFALSGCAYSMSEFAAPQSTGAPVALVDPAPDPAPDTSIATGSTAPAAAPVAKPAPAVLVQQVPASASAPSPTPPTTMAADLDRPYAAGSASTVATDAYPNLNEVPVRPKDDKLLTPEEKAKVVAELEALAKAQGAPTAEARKAADAECKNAALNALDPETRLKRELAGQEC